MLAQCKKATCLRAFTGLQWTSVREGERKRGEEEKRKAKGK